jgi:ATP-dependent DNA helicase RecG
LYEYLKERIQEHHEQAYFVYPLVEASEGLAGRMNVVEGAEFLANGPLAGLPIGVLHGRMAAAEKDAVMQRFARGELKVLCSTTVIEVGVDVGAATMMVIESPDLFGLSQLHQLRGRVGRSSARSFCVLMVDPLRTSDDATERLNAFVENEDGFKLSEIDLMQRGPGLLLGARQAGVAEFRYGDLVRDSHLLEEARTVARRMILGDAGV